MADIESKHTQTPLKEMVSMYVTCSNVTEQLRILKPLQTNSTND